MLVGEWALDSLAVSFLGAGLFVVGVAWFFVAAIRDGQRSGLGFGGAVRRSARRAVRFAFELMP
jgi:hypothetical protein